MKLQLKEEAIKVSTSLPTEVTNMTEMLGVLENATQAKELLEPVKQYSDAELRLTQAKKALKDAVKVESDKVKSAEKALKTIEDEIKAKALELVKPIVETKFNKTTGEQKTIESNNLPFGYSYTPEKVSKAIDFEAIENDILEKQVKEIGLAYGKDFTTKKIINGNVYEIAEIVISVKLNKAGIANALEAGAEFPMKTITKPANISIQKKVLTDVANQEKIEKLIEATKEE